MMRHTLALFILMCLAPACDCQGGPFSEPVPPKNIIRQASDLVGDARIRGLDAQCAGLDERACKASPFCRPGYGGSCPTCEDMAYKGCSHQPPEVHEEMELYKRQCKASGGVLIGSDLHGVSCRCPPHEQAQAEALLLKEGPNHFLPEHGGCLTYAAVCRKARGVWRRRAPHEIRTITQYNPNRGTCISDFRNSARWDEDKGTCVFTTDGFECFLDGKEAFNMGQVHGRLK